MKFVVKISIFAIIGLVGCTTVNDFRQMNPEKRAEIACKNRREIRSLIEQQNQYKSSIASTQSDLNRGYKLHTQCRNVEVKGDATVSCNSNFGYTTCNETRPTETRQVCQDTPVPLNYELERDNLNRYQTNARALETKLSATWSSCLRYVGGLSADDAYKFYSN